jgi:hypothetical protein
MTGPPELSVCGESITRRPDTSPETGIREYGEVLFADPVNNTYPVDTQEHIEAAWRYIHRSKTGPSLRPRM